MQINTYLRRRNITGLFMNNRSHLKARRTFACRAGSYENETGWVTSRDLLKPLVPNPVEFPAPNPCLFLDVCTGTGQVAKLANELGWTTVVVDQSEEMLVRIGSSEILAIRANATELPFATNSFEICAMRQALHYFDTREMLIELLRVSRYQVRLGHITTHDKEDTELWENYFKTASPGRLKVFAPGDIRTSIEALGFKVANEKILYSLEDFDGPINYLGEAEVQRLKSNFLDGDPRVVSRYVYARGPNDKLTLKLRWEFLIVTT